MGGRLAGETDADNWSKRFGARETAAPGVYLFLLSLAGGEPTLAADLKLVGVGLYIAGGEKAPLLSAKGYQLRSAEALLDLDTVRAAPRLEGVLSLSGLGIPLAPSGAGQGPNSTAVAASLLAGAAARRRRRSIRPSESTSPIPIGFMAASSAKTRRQRFRPRTDGSGCRSVAGSAAVLPQDRPRPRRQRPEPANRL